MAIGISSAAATNGVIANSEPEGQAVHFTRANSLGPMAHRSRVGSLEIVVVSDGPLPIGSPADVFAGPDSVALDDLRTPADELVLAQNVLAVRSAAGWALFETGVSSIQQNETAGQLHLGLARVGIHADAIQAIVPTHGHLDHIGGIMAEDGRRNFPNAQIHLQEAELAFWLDDRRLGQRGERSGLAARKSLAPNLDRIVCHRDGSEILPSIHAMHTPGHTVGHTSFLISSGTEELFVAGDLAHHVSQIEHPGIGTQFDTDPSLAAATRLRMLDFLATRQILSIFYHLDWPGIGFIEKRGGGFRFVPVRDWPNP
jgi:glyoxylase-like metal-dependent hydrolase (beta-lactamase superfamily II)